jgi:hypothetical protein
MVLGVSPFMVRTLPGNDTGRNGPVTEILAGRLDHMLRVVRGRKLHEEDVG